MSLREENRSNFLDLSSEFLSILLPFLTMPPNVEVNHSCILPSPKIPSYLPHCVHLQKPRKVGVLIQFGFEADILEIHLNELKDMVDYFFILESIQSHFLGVPKPLIWEDIKNQDRFERFLSKVVHLVLDDSDLPTSITQGKGLDAEPFKIEALQEKLRWLKFLRWNNITQYFSDDDILGFGDVDEIPSRDVVFYLKHCKIPSDPVDIGIWFPFGKINQAFQTDWPVPDHPFTLGDPTYWTIKAALNANKFPSRNRGTSLGYLLGGMHMTHYGYLPIQIVEYFTASESNHETVLTILIPILRNLSTSSLRTVEMELGGTPKQFNRRITSMENFKRQFPYEYKQIVQIPWFYNCNRNRYPSWEGLRDTRLY
ncbi:unnamed protein product [Orchesella dallaii]|uniref:Beta-1,4-mannosyl-glycoprotein 4-beta-N-acetylglucosaminyltransferase n=1 Tax=Orchesella dallaii TaxID=48710 RepID=A0ABP1QC13_9HEXA